LVRRLIADELILSFVPNGEQRIWRSLTRMKMQLMRDRVRLQNQIECLLEEMRIKLSIVVSNLLGVSGLRILHALAEGETDPKKLAQLGDERLQYTEEQLGDSLTGRLPPASTALAGAGAIGWSFSGCFQLELVTTLSPSAWVPSLHFGYSVFAFLRTGMSGSASFQSMWKFR
jgi:hypothetical protein